MYATDAPLPVSSRYISTTPHDAHAQVSLARHARYLPPPYLASSRCSMFAWPLAVAYAAAADSGVSAGHPSAVGTTCELAAPPTAAIGVHVWSWFRGRSAWSAVDLMRASPNRPRRLYPSSQPSHRRKTLIFCMHVPTNWGATYLLQSQAAPGAGT